MSQYTYVVSPGGDEDASPCKVGITTQPQARIYGIRSKSGIDEPKYAAVYTSEMPPKVVENEYHDELSSHRSEEGGEWFDVSTGLVVEALDNHERCSRAKVEPLLHSKTNSGSESAIANSDGGIVGLNVCVRKNVRKALGKLKLEREENIEDLVDEALREYIERH